MADPADPFEEREWHDAQLLDLHVDRRAPGERDDVAVVIRWPGGVVQQLHFEDCYALDAEMNFGVIAKESILDARTVTDDPKLADLRGRWGRLGVDLSKLRCFEITTSSTASTIRVYARAAVFSDL